MITSHYIVVCNLDAKLVFHPYTSSTINCLADVGLPRSPIIKTGIHVANTAGEMMWSCNAAAIEREGSANQHTGLDALKGRSMCARSITFLLRSACICYFVRHRLRGDHIIMPTVRTKYLTYY